MHRMVSTFALLAIWGSVASAAATEVRNILDPLLKTYPQPADVRCADAGDCVNGLIATTAARALALHVSCLIDPARFEAASVTWPFDMNAMAERAMKLRMESGSDGFIARLFDDAGQLFAGHGGRPRSGTSGTGATLQRPGCSISDDRG